MKSVLTFVPVWAIQDILVFIAALLVVFYIVKKEERPIPVLLEFFCFVFLYASVYENLATWMGLYGYGKSVVMVMNVPLSVPVYEFLIVYATLKLLGTTKMPGWCKPVVVGVFGMLADFSLDPVSIKQVFTAAGATIGRWTWYPGASDVQIYGEPVYNFTGWVLLCGYAAAFLVLGRWWFKKSGYKPLVGYLYPPLMMLAALGVMVSPVSQFLLWLGPIYAKGSNAEWVMMGFFFLTTAVIFAAVWRGRMRSSLSLREDWPLFLPLVGFHFVNILFGIIGGYWQVLWLAVIAFVVQTGAVLCIYFRGKTAAK